jgi:ubiquinone/menaquinone biosynthesis C-methylase UbiE
MYDNQLKLFQRSKDAIWTDEYISKSLLNAHFDESNDGASRKYDRRVSIINWINKRIEPHSKIIDLGCGPGLYAYELGKLGHNVLGIDFNKESINYALENKCIKGYVEYKYCNYLEDSIEGNYNTAMMIYCDFGALIPDEQKLLLKKMYNLLDENGIFIFDIFGKNELKNQQEKRYWYISNGNDFWSKEPYFYMEETKIFENENVSGRRYYLINQTTGKIKEFIMWDQYYDEDRINKFMSENRFEIIKIDKDLVTYKEETLFIIAKKKKL